MVDAVLAEMSLAVEILTAPFLVVGANAGSLGVTEDVAWDSVEEVVVFLAAVLDAEVVCSLCLMGDWLYPHSSVMYATDMVSSALIGSCLQEGGGGGSEEDETSTSESCSATATPSVTTVCDYACPDGASTSCATLCTSLTISCEPTGFVNFSPGTVDADGIPATLLDASDDAITSAAQAAASWLNPFYTSLDPVMTNGTTMTASATAPAVTTSTSKTTATAISASSCAITSASSSSYCSCDGGYGVTLSTKANTAKTTFLVCDVTPELTVSTILPKTTSTKTTSTTTSSASESTSTGFALYMTYWSASECPIGLTCESGSKWNAVYVENLWGDQEAVPLKGTWNEGGMVDGSKATFCDQTSTFTIDGDGLKGSSSSSKYGSYVCKKHAVPEENTWYDSENTVSYDITKAWECITDICKA